MVPPPGGAGCAPAASGESGGTHPPLTHTQFDAGLIVVQLVLCTGGIGCVGAGATAPAASGESGGTHPPLMHTQVGAGLIVVHVLGGGDGAGDGDGEGDGDGAGAGGGGGGGSGSLAGGTHAPFTHVQPGPGAGPTQLAGLGAAPPAPVVKVRTADEATRSRLTFVAIVRDTTCQ